MEDEMPGLDVVGATKISDGLYIGDQFASKDLDTIVLNHITHIINCSAREVPNHFESYGIRYLSYAWTETDRDIVLDQNDRVLREVTAFIEEARQMGESCLVHTLQGYSTSFTLYAGYFMQKYQWTLYKVLQFLDSRVAKVEIKSNSFRQLKLLENRLFENNPKLSNDWVGRPANHEELIMRNTFVNSQILRVQQLAPPTSTNQTLYMKIKKKNLTWKEDRPQVHGKLNESKISQNKDSRVERLSIKPKSILKNSGMSEGGRMPSEKKSEKGEQKREDRYQLEDSRQGSVYKLSVKKKSPALPANNTNQVQKPTQINQQNYIAQPNNLTQTSKPNNTAQTPPPNNTNHTPLPAHPTLPNKTEQRKVIHLFAGQMMRGGSQKKIIQKEKLQLKRPQRQNSAKHMQDKSFSTRNSYMKNGQSPSIRQSSILRTKLNCESKRVLKSQTSQKDTLRPQKPAYEYPPFITLFKNDQTPPQPRLKRQPLNKSAENLGEVQVKQKVRFDTDISDVCRKEELTKKLIKKMIADKTKITVEDKQNRYKQPQRARPIDEELIYRPEKGFLTLNLKSSNINQIQQEKPMKKIDNFVQESSSSNQPNLSLKTSVNKSLRNDSPGTKKSDSKQNLEKMKASLSMKGTNQRTSSPAVYNSAFNLKEANAIISSIFAKDGYKPKWKF